jgi:hypothetical protein
VYKYIPFHDVGVPVNSHFYSSQQLLQFVQTRVLLKMFTARTNADKSWDECVSAGYHDADCGVCVSVCVCVFLDLGSEGPVSLSGLVTAQPDS